MLLSFKSFLGINLISHDGTSGSWALKTINCTFIEIARRSIRDQHLVSGTHDAMTQDPHSFFFEQFVKVLKSEPRARCETGIDIRKPNMSFIQWRLKAK